MMCLFVLFGLGGKGKGRCGGKERFEREREMEEEKTMAGLGWVSLGRMESY